MCSKARPTCCASCILSGLGLDGTPSLLALPAFDVGVELAWLVTVALLFPSLYPLSRTRAYPAVRLAGAATALAAVITHPWYVGAARVPRRCRVGLVTRCCGPSWPGALWSWRVFRDRCNSEPAVQPANRPHPWTADPVGFRGRRSESGREGHAG